MDNWKTLREWVYREGHFCMEMMFSVKEDLDLDVWIERLRCYAVLYQKMLSMEKQHEEM